MIGLIYRVMVMAVGHKSVLPIRVPAFRGEIPASKMTTAADQGD